MYSFPTPQFFANRFPYTYRRMYVFLPSIAPKPTKVPVADMAEMILEDGSGGTRPSNTHKPQAAYG